MPAPGPAPRPAAPLPAPPARTPRANAPGRVGASGGEVAPGVLELKGMTEFKPPGSIAEFLDTRKTSTVNARFGNIAQGPITVTTASQGKYRFKKQSLPLTHPLFARAAEAVPDLAPSLMLDLDGAKLSGRVGLVAGERVEELRPYLSKAPEMLGLAGFTVSALPGIVNALEAGSLHLGLTNVPIRLGSAFSGSFSLDAKDEAITFSGNAVINVKGLVRGALDLKRAPDGAITGKASVAVNMPKNISGSVEVAWDGRAITGEGKVGYKGEKLSGEVTLRLMERGQAEQLEATNKAPEGTPAPAPAAAKPKSNAKVDYVVFGEGDLTFAFNDWLNGAAHVIVDPKGFLTIIGKITPQKEFILFKQKDYERQLFKVEARASYGIPVVGNIFIFANVSLGAFATLGPAKFYNIVVEGTYSTDPKKANSFTIRGSLNISAAAGLRLRGEAGVGLTILAHDIKAGAGVNGIAGIKGYAEATPIIGYREKAAEGQDKKGEFFIRGELEIAAQPFLGLSGDVFVEIDAPWWSPVPDKRWTWPLGGKEWPIGGSLGVGASVDYVFGSNEWPKFDFKPVEFDSTKFMSDLYQDKAKSGSGKEVEKPGKWAEKNAKAADPPPKKPPLGNAKPGKAAPPPPAKAKVAPGGGGKGGKPADPTARTKEGKTVKQLQDEATKKGKKPPDQAGKSGAAAKQEPTKTERPAATQNPAEIAKAIAAAVVATSFESAGESHQFFADVEGGKPTLEVASRRLNVLQFIDALDRQADLLEDNDRKAAKDAIKKARGEVAKLADEFARSVTLRERELNEHLSRIRTQSPSAGKALGEALKKATAGVKSGVSREQAIPIEWFKPWSAYPNKIVLPGNVGQKEFFRDQSAAFDAKDSRKIGVKSSNKPTTGKKLQRKKKEKRKEEASFYGILSRRGYKWDKENTNADHVHDLGFDGKDDFENLWPLDAGANSNANRVYRQRVPYREGGEVKVGTVYSLEEKWFEIKKGGK